MILYVEGDLFQAPTQVLVNTVNTVGAMGKGLALTFKKLYPDMYEEYRSLCEENKIEIGKLWLYKSPNKWVLNFPTKKHWRYPSKPEYIEAGLEKFASVYDEMEIHSIAFPALGCGNGGLDFENVVQPLMHDHLSGLPIETFIYPGQESRFVEHESPNEMKEWLRSEPTSLPFSEVWRDLAGLLSEDSKYCTIARGNVYFANATEAPKGIEIIASGRRYFVNYEDLLAFWQQLRTHGFTMRQTASGIDREVSYLAPIFSKLTYVTPVHVADSYEKLQNSTITGLQVLPAVNGRSEKPKTEQLSLFENGQKA